MGEFFDPRPQPKHKCLLPTSRGRGGWRCHCGLAYVVREFGERDRGVDPYESTWQWRRSAEHDRT